MKLTNEMLKVHKYICLELKNQRLLKQLKQDRVAFDLGISPSYLSNLENGKRNSTALTTYLANANTIMQQKSKQQMAKTSSTQVLRNKSYNNAYTSLDNSKRVNNTNHVQDEENQERDKNEKQERNSKNKGITR